MLENLLVGIVGSLVASLVFLIALFSLRPKIVFSPYIANQSKADEAMYGFKLINKSRFPLTHVEFQLTLITPKAVPNGVVLRNRLIPLTKGNVFEVGGYSRKDKDAHYAIRVGTPEDLCSVCESEGQYLYFTVVAQHSLSGFSGVFTKYYYPKSDIKRGHHEFGSGLDVR
ncbi:hypothetical protein [Nitrosovibrio sp. Nv4]|uniref:hypothetical protein n=1 Tax=Nitrosovibrio sp. Nv4 TaxID=1945880 RepID=UPI000BD41A19|nr:hypothetical protein [Nitrosovibrio sp. Nv4]SOD40397.1 hypothetical protein SAMN06298226_0660 [Nitrosovibrio sp. Nv4]